MDAAEYERMYRLEGTLWWYTALHARTLAVARRCLAGHPTARILDAGCGTGGMAARLAALGAVTALDVSPVAIGFAARRAPELGSAPGLGRASVERLPVRDGAFDLVVSLDVLCHGAVKDEAAALAEMARALRPRGHLVLNLPAYPWLLSGHDRQVLNVRRYHAGQVRSMLEAAGLRPVEVRFWNSLLFAPAALLRLVRRGAARGSDLVAPPAWLNRTLEAVVAFERAIGRVVPFPFGLSIFAVARKPGA